ncbi:hypothetical protein V7O66_13880 [Methanolobus sp. ZRKC3]|uniref:hypothetical protein n=1 Tax=Methanolobus sp. ZRKC3 TaxID=3125786 RepID=UPI003243746F
MNAKELATKLNGVEYGKMHLDLCDAAEENGLVIVYGASDDLMEFMGAIDDEIGAFDGTTVYLDENGLLQNKCDNESCPHFINKLSRSKLYVRAIWQNSMPCWTYDTNLPHETYDMMDEGELYCKGIVFSLTDIKNVDRDQRILAIVKKYSDKLDLPNHAGADYVYQSDAPQEAAVEMFAEIADILMIVELEA